MPGCARPGLLWGVTSLSLSCLHLFACFFNKNTCNRVYRRAQLAQWSNAVDRHIQQLLKDGMLVKLSGGLYHCPQKTAFGTAPADAALLVAAFLNDDRFLITSPNVYNTLGVGTTQLYNDTIVYNHKRHGRYTLGGRVFEFRMKPTLPQQLSHEFLLVDLVNNLGQLAESAAQIKVRIADKVTFMDHSALLQAARYYGKVGTRKFFAAILADAELNYG